MKTIRILLADDHAVVRQGFKMILGAAADMEIVGEAGNGREAVELALEQLKPDSHRDGRRHAGAERHRSHAAHDRGAPHARVLALSMHKDSVYVREILRAGAKRLSAQGFGRRDLVSKPCALVARGEGYISPAVSNAVLDDYRSAS
jgi:two-component system response regulator NreC